VPFPVFYVRSINREAKTGRAGDYATITPVACPNRDRRSVNRCGGKGVDALDLRLLVRAFARCSAETCPASKTTVALALWMKVKL
jgi:hypothetical protein